MPLVLCVPQLFQSMFQTPSEVQQSGSEARPLDLLMDTVRSQSAAGADEEVRQRIQSDRQNASERLLMGFEVGGKWTENGP